MPPTHPFQFYETSIGFYVWGDSISAGEEFPPPSTPLFGFGVVIRGHEHVYKILKRLQG